MKNTFINDISLSALLDNMNKLEYVVKSHKEITFNPHYLNDIISIYAFDALEGAFRLNIAKNEEQIFKLVRIVAEFGFSNVSSVRDFISSGDFDVFVDVIQECKQYGFDIVIKVLQVKGIDNLAEDCKKVKRAIYDALNS